MAKKEVDAGKEIKEAAKEKREQQRFDRVSTELIKSREASSKQQHHLKNQLSDNAKKQVEAFKGLLKPSSMIKAVGLASGSPMLAILGGKLGEIVEIDKEKKEAAKTENKKVADLLKKNGKSSGEIASIIKQTAKMSGENEDELFAKLSKLGFKDKEVFDKFLAIKKEGDEKLIASNFDIVQGFKAQGIEEKEHARRLRYQLNAVIQDQTGQFVKAIEKPKEKDQLQEQKDDEKMHLMELQTKAMLDMSKYTEEMSQGLQILSDELKDADWGTLAMLGIGGALLAPIFMVIGFFEELNVGIKAFLVWTNKFFAGGPSKILTKIAKPFMIMIDWINDAGTKLKSWFSPLGKLFSKFVASFGKLSKPFLAILDISKSFGRMLGNLLGKILIPLQIVMSLYDTVTGFIDGYAKNDSIIDGIKGALYGLVDGLIGGLLRMIASGAAWFLEFIGFTTLASKLENGVNNLLTSFYGLITGFVDLVIGVFTLDPTKIIAQLGNLVNFMIDAIMFVPEMLIGLITDLFDLAGITMPVFDIATFLKNKVGDVIGWISNALGFDAPERKIYSQEAERSPNTASPDVNAAIDNAVSETGVSKAFMQTMAKIESNNNPNATNKSGAKGLYQFMPGTAEQYGIDGQEFDPKASALAAAKLAMDNKKALERAGIEASDENLYLAHQQGAQGVIDLYKADKTGERMSKRARRNMTANLPPNFEVNSPGDFLEGWKEHYRKKSVGDPVLSSRKQANLTNEVARQSYANATQKAPTDNSSVNTAINTNNNKIIQSPDMSTMNPDVGFADAVMGA
jgi:hypothetical protein